MTFPKWLLYLWVFAALINWASFIVSLLFGHFAIGSLIQACGWSAIVYYTLTRGMFLKDEE